MAFKIIKSSYKKIVSIQTEEMQFQSQIRSEDGVFTDHIEAARYLLQNHPKESFLYIGKKMKMLISAGRTKGDETNFIIAGYAADIYRRSPTLRSIKPFDSAMEAAVWIRDNIIQLKKETRSSSISYIALALVIGGKVSVTALKYARVIQYVEKYKSSIILRIIDAFRASTKKGSLDLEGMKRYLDNCFEEGLIRTLDKKQEPMQDHYLFIFIVQICLRLYKDEILLRLTKDEKQLFPPTIYGRAKITRSYIRREVTYERPFFQYNGIRFSFKDDIEMYEMLKNDKCEVVLTKKYLLFRNKKTMQEWKIFFDDEGYLISSNGSRIKVKRKHVNILIKHAKKPDSIIFVGFWKIALKRDVPSGEKIDIDDLSGEIQRKSSLHIQVKANVKKNGLIKINIKDDEECYLWSLQLKRKYRNKKVRLVVHKNDNQIRVSLFEDKPDGKHIDDFYYDLILNRFYKIILNGEEIIRSYIEVVSDSLRCTHGDITYFFHDQAKVGDPWLIHYNAKNRFIWAHNPMSQSRNKKSSHYEITRDNKIVGYLLSSLWPLRKLDITGRIERLILIEQSKQSNSIVFRFQGKTYFVSPEDRNKVKPGSFVYPELEDGMLIGASVSLSEDKIYLTLVRDENWALLSSMGYTKDKESLSGIRIIEGVYTCRCFVRDVLYHGVNIGGTVYPIGSPVTGMYESMRVAVVINLKEDFPRAQRRVIYWKPVQRFSNSNRIDITNLIQLPALPIYIFRKNTVIMRKKIMDMLSEIYCSTQTPNGILTELKKRIISDNFSPDDLAVLIDVLYIFSTNQELDPKIMSTFNKVLEMVFGIFEIGLLKKNYIEQVIKLLFAFDIALYRDRLQGEE